MKRIILLIGFISFYIYGFGSKHDVFQGSWISNSVVYSFQNDSLYVDEINNEGDVYKYNYRNGIVKVIDSFGDEFYFKIDKISDNKLKIQFEGEKPFILNKVTNYDLDKMSFSEK